MPSLPRRPTAHDGQGRRQDRPGLSQPSPAERLAARLDQFPNACRDVLAELDRARLQGGGVVILRLEVGPGGDVQPSIELVRRYARGGA